MQAGHPHAVSGRPMLIHTCHAMPCRDLEKSLLERRGYGMAFVNQTWPHCVNQMGKTQFKPLVAWHRRRMAWERHSVCELALILPFSFTYFSIEVYFPADFNFYKPVFTCTITHNKVLFKLISYVFFINYALKFKYEPIWLKWHAVAQLVEALCYKPEGCMLNSR
jgi:hypothetical protein